MIEKTSSASECLARGILHRLMSATNRRMHKGFPEMLSYLLRKPMEYCSHRFSYLIIDDGWRYAIARSLAEHSRLHCGRMRRLLQPSYECFGMHLGRFELVPIPVAHSRLPVPLALSTRRPTAVYTFTGISQIMRRLYSDDLAECVRLHRFQVRGTGCWVLPVGARYWVLGIEYSAIGARDWTLGTGYWISSARY